MITPRRFGVRDPTHNFKFMQSPRGGGAAHRNASATTAKSGKPIEKNRSRPAAFRMARVERLRCYELSFLFAEQTTGYMSPPGVGTGIVEPGTTVDGAIIISGLPPAQLHDSPPVAYPPPP